MGAIVALVAAVVGAAAATAVGGGIVGAIVGAIVTAGIRFVAGGLFGKASSSGRGATPNFNQSFVAKERDLTQVIRSPITPRRVVYGEKMLSGPMVFATTTGTDNKFLHAIIALAGHECFALGDVYVGDQRVAARFTASDTVISASGTDFDNKVMFTPHLGSSQQAVDQTLVAAAADWTVNHRLQGLAYGYFRLEYDQDTFPNGLPNLRVIVKGRKVWDCRSTAALTIVDSAQVSEGLVEIETSTAHGLLGGTEIIIWGHSDTQIRGRYAVESILSTNRFTIREQIATVTGYGVGGSVYLPVYTDNIVLCALDYIIDRSFGLGADEDEINLTQIAAAASIADEQVPLTQKTETFTANHTYNMLTRAGAVPINTGSIVQVGSTDTLPTGLTASTDYYYAAMGTAGEFGLATTRQNALEGNVIALTGNGAGSHSLTRISQPRYTCNVAWPLDTQHVDVLEDFRASCAGAIVNVQGMYHIFVGSEGAAVGSITLDDLRDDYEVQTGPERAQLFNRVTGTYSSVSNLWQPADFPPVSNAMYRAEDGQTLTRDIELPCTTDPTEAQRVATIYLNRSRQGITYTFPGKLTLAKYRHWDVVTVDNQYMGWDAKQFRVIDWNLAVGEKGELGVDLVLQEDADEVYDWNLGQELDYDPAPNTNLPSATAIAPPSDLWAVSGASWAKTSSDGTITPRIQVTWAAPENAFVRGYDLEWKINDEETYNSFFVPAPNTGWTLGPVEALTLYDIRVRAVNTWGARSDYVSIQHFAIGQDVPPPDVDYFFVTRLADGTRRFEFGFETQTPPEIRSGGGFIIRYTSGTTFDPDSATSLHTGVLTSSPYETNKPDSAGTYAFGITSINSSGTESANPVVIIITLGDPRLESVVLQRYEVDEGWPGTKTDCFKNYPAGFLEAEGLQTWDDLAASWGLLANAWRYIVESKSPISYQTPVIDVSVNLSFTPLVTVTGDGTVDVQMRAASEAYGPDLTALSYQSVQRVTGTRYIQFKTTVTGSAPLIKSMDMLFDAETATDSYEDIDTTAISPEWFFERLATGHFKISAKSDIALISRATITAIQNVGSGWTWELLSKNAHVTGSPANIAAAEFKIYDTNGALADAIIDVTITGPISSGSTDDVIIQDQSFFVPDGAASGYVVGQLVFSGTPTPTFSISSGNTGAAFAVDSITGRVTVAGTIDRSTTSSYSLLVEAVNFKSSDTATISITVTQVAAAPTMTGATWNIPDSISNGAAVGTAVAQGDGTITYAVVSGNAAGAFALNAATGLVTVADRTALPVGSPNIVTLTISATSAGGSTNAGFLVVVDSSAAAASYFFDFSLGNLPPGATFTRASTGHYLPSSFTMAEAAVDAPRFEWTWMLYETEPLTDLIGDNEAIGGAAWSNAGTSIVVTTNTTDLLDPMGGNTATKLEQWAGGDNGRIFQTMSGAPADNTLYSASVFLRSHGDYALSLATVILMFGTATQQNYRCQFDLVGQTATGYGDTAGATYKIEDYGNGWYRCTITATNAGTGAGWGGIQIEYGNDLWDYSVTGIIYAWGAVLNQGYNSTYHDTTRAVEVLTLDVPDDIYDVTVTTPQGSYVDPYVIVTGGAGYALAWPLQAATDGRTQITSVTVGVAGAGGVVGTDGGTVIADTGGGGGGGGGISEGNIETPAPIVGQSYVLVKNYDFGTNGNVRNYVEFVDQFFTRYIWAGGYQDSLGGNGELQGFRGDDDTVGYSGSGGTVPVSDVHIFNADSITLRAVVNYSVYNTYGWNWAPGYTDACMHAAMGRTKWTFTYGFVQVRVKLAGWKPAYWPAAWLAAGSQTWNGSGWTFSNDFWPPEIDFLEFPQKFENGVWAEPSTRVYPSQLHGGNPSDGGSNDTYRHPNLGAYNNYEPGFDFSLDWHTFACHWEENRARLYVDDVLVRDAPWTWVNDAGTIKPQAHILINTAVGGSWPGVPNDTNDFPYDYEVDYLRIWQYDANHLVSSDPFSTATANYSGTDHIYYKEWNDGYSDGASELRYAPPAQTSPTTINLASVPNTTSWTFGASEDVIFVGDATTARIRRIQFTGGRHVRIRGGYIDLQVQADAAINATDVTGSLFIEGVRMNCGAFESDGIRFGGAAGTTPTIYIQNCRIEGVLGTAPTAHGNCIRAVGPVGTVYIDKVSGYTDYQGLYAPPASATGNYYVSRCNFRYAPATSTALTYLWWWYDNCSQPTATSHHIYHRECYGDPRVQNGADQVPVNYLVFPARQTSGGCGAIYVSGTGGDGTLIGWPSWTRIHGYVKVGLPGGGDFAKATDVGLGYTSPGYQDGGSW